MRIANVRGRLKLLTDDGGVDVIAELSAILPLLPGDVIFTGTPAGIGATRQPPRFLQPGEVLSSYVEGIGTLRNRFIAAAKQG